MFVSCSKPVTVTETRIALGTYVKLVLVADARSESDAREVMEQGFEHVLDYGDAFDYRSRESGLSSFNRSTLLRKNENPVLFELISESLRYARLTNGWFDPTILPVVQAWGFDTESPSVPGVRELRNALDNVGYEQVRIRGDVIEKPGEVKLDLSGIAKGKIVDLLAGHFRENGFTDFLVDAGGDIYVSGSRGRGENWRVAIQDPLHRQSYQGILSVSDTAVITSGDYERFFTIGDRRYSHLLDPETGYPGGNARSVTVLTQSAAYGDAVATAVFIMGREKGLAFLEANDIPGLILYENANGKLESVHTHNFWE